MQILENVDELCCFVHVYSISSGAKYFTKARRGDLNDLDFDELQTFSQVFCSSLCTMKNIPFKIIPILYTTVNTFQRKQMHIIVMSLN